MQFLQQKTVEAREDDQRIQIIVTTHSPNLASVIDLNNLSLLHHGKAFPMADGSTRLEHSDYGFLQRFLDVTKANMFFARGLLIVEGDAEDILLPTIARLIGRDLTQSGVSIINVGGTGLRRFSRIYQRMHPDKDGIIDIPIACVADADVMPDCAPEIIGKVKPGEKWPDKKDRRWRAKSDFTDAELEHHLQNIRDKASGQYVKTFVADEWTLEYDLSYFGLAREVWVAAHMARDDEAISSGKTTRVAVARKALYSFAVLGQKELSKEELCSNVYQLFSGNSGISKPTAAQYLACVLEVLQRKGHLPPEKLRAVLPPYITEAIEYVTGQNTHIQTTSPGNEDQVTHE
jgi:putative ATP-dependent endonuclease of OLD family